MFERELRRQVEPLFGTPKGRDKFGRWQRQERLTMLSWPALSFLATSQISSRSDGAKRGFRP
ncbi:hypothetical protein [uncultured Parasphingopyxis sp.]|uniref:hypothetical protein n=1 Tax=uncultured Parasphingopyxis sp. TaxID=1547918 RepID=UPI002628C243|nr:hypothetical protein [uncultured Parasphingopyxis sp.]